MPSILLNLDLFGQSSECVDDLGRGCPICEGFLAIHQPDEQAPHHLVGTCEGCGSWFLIDDAEGLMLRLPTAEDLRDARSSSRGAVA